MTKQKSIISVYDACKMAYDKMPDYFRGYDFCELVKNITVRPRLMDATITKRLREIRSGIKKPTDFEIKNNKTYNYRMYDSPKSIYQKIKSIV